MFRSIPFTIEEQMDKEALKERLFLNREIRPSPDGRFQDCWYWTGCLNNTRYGQFNFRNKYWRPSWASVYIYLNYIRVKGSGLCVLHKCDNPACFNPEHLFIGTYKENEQDKINKGRKPNGENISNHKLTTEQILNMKEKYETGDYSQRDLAKIFGVVQPTVQRILKGTAWKHLLPVDH